MPTNSKNIEVDDEEEVYVDSNLKIDAIKKEYTIKNKYYPLIEANLPKNEKTLLRHIGQYRDKNISILSSPYPLRYPLWKAEDSQIIFDSTGINQKDLEADIRNVVATLETKEVKNFTAESTVLVLIIKYYIENMEKEKLNMVYYYMAYSMYWTIFYKYFSIHHHSVFVPPREETMIYTINNLSNKFILKKLASIDNLLYYSVSKTIEALRQRVKRSSDGELCYVIGGLKTRLNNYFNKITDAYIKNDRSKNVIFKSDELNDDETVRENSSISGTVETFANEFTNKFFSGSPNASLIKWAATNTNISASELRTTLNLLLSNQRIDQVKRFYAALFYVFLSDPEASADSVKSMKFLAVMEKLYRKSNTNDKNIVAVKTLMNEWLEEGSKTYRASNRQATLNNFRKAIYYYFILLVVNNR